MKENLKKLFAVVLVVAMLAAQIVVPTNAATGYYCTNCGHDGQIDTVAGPKRTIPATCGDVGYQIYACVNPDCDPAEGVEATVTVVIPATNVHTGDNDVKPAVPSTCTAPGTKAYETCTGCNAKLEPGTTTVIDDIVDPIDPHPYTSKVTDPGCLTGGYTTYTCPDCGDSYVDDEKPALKHDFSVDVPAKAATCKEEGYTAHKKCSRCDEIDPENPKTVVAIQDHNLHIDQNGSKAASCTEDGWNLFVCENADCSYYEGKGGIKETITKNGHSLEPTAAKDPTCEEDGNHAYWYCSICKKYFKEATAETAFADEAATVIAKAGHTQMAVDHKLPTCTEDGAKDGIVCAVCDKTLYSSVAVPATGHTLTVVGATTSTCDTQGNIEHKKCSVCEKLFAKDTPDTENADATPITEESVLLPLRQHVTVERTALEATCTTTGVKVTTCTYDDCDYVVSATIDAKGHDLKSVPEKPATCLVDGVKAHKECAVCNNRYSTSTVNSDIAAKALSDAKLKIAAPGHTEATVDFQAPTYDDNGHNAGKRCSVCATALDGAETIFELDEAIKFTYEVTGVTDTTSIAVNSGTITMKIYFEVLADLDDEYESEVLANIFGIDFQVGYDKAAFNLESVDDVNVPFAGNFSATPKATADSNGIVKISQNAETAAGVAFKKSEGKVLLTTLVFNVMDGTAKGNYTFDFAWDVIHPDNDAAENPETIDTSLSDTSIEVEVRTLGDANYSTDFSQADILKITQYIEMAAESETPVDYVAEYDMNKDGFIDGVDLSLLRRAIVGDDAYLY